MTDRQRRLVIAAGVVLLLVGMSSIVYYVLGDGQYGLLDCVYMTLVTLTTVGFREILPVNEIPGAKAFTMLLLIVGIGTMAYFFSSLTAFVVEGDLQKIIGKRRMQRRIDKLEAHTIILGIGRTGIVTASQFLYSDQPTVLVDRDLAVLEAFQHHIGHEVLHVVGDATSDKTLLAAGVQRARGLICAMDSDQSNLYSVLTARQLAGTKLRIVSRASTTNSAEKLHLVGADRTVAPAELGGRRLFAEVVRPEATSFLETLLMDHGRGVHIQEVELGDGAEMVGSSLAEANLRSRVGGDLLVLAYRAAGTHNFTPAAPHAQLEAGATLIVMGDRDAVRKLRTLAHAEKIS